MLQSCYQDTGNLSRTKKLTEFSDTIWDVNNCSEVLGIFFSFIIAVLNQFTDLLQYVKFRTKLGNHMSVGDIRSKNSAWRSNSEPLGAVSETDSLLRHAHRGFASISLGKHQWKLEKKTRGQTLNLKSSKLTCSRLPLVLILTHQPNRKRKIKCRCLCC